MRLHVKQYKQHKMYLHARRKIRIRRKVFGIVEKPRLSVFRSAKHIYVQAIDDKNGITISSATSLDLKNEENFSKVIEAMKVGELLGNRLHEKGVKMAIFDRNGFAFSGRVAALAEGVRKMGVKF